MAHSLGSSLPDRQAASLGHRQWSPHRPGGLQARQDTSSEWGRGWVNRSAAGVGRSPGVGRGAHCAGGACRYSRGDGGQPTKLGT